MSSHKEIKERVEKNIADLKAVYDLFVLSPKYVKSSTFSTFNRGSIELNFNRGDAIETAYVDVDRDGFFVIRLGCWCAMTPSARERIENKSFESAHEALVYALETIEKINRFFDQF